MITQEMIKDKLNNSLVGKDYEHYHVGSMVMPLIEGLLGDNPNKAYLSGGDCLHGAQYYDVRYKNHCLLTITYTKKKGERKRYGYLFGEAYNYWSFKSFDVKLHYTSVEDGMCKIDEQVQKEHDSARQKHELAKNITRKIMSDFNLKYYDAFDICKYIERHQYTIEKELKGE